MFPGRTYTLTDKACDSTRYYRLVRELADRSLEIVPGESALLHEIRSAAGKGRISRFFSHSGQAVTKIYESLEISLLPFLPGVNEHLKNLSVADRFDRTIRTTLRQYLFFMLEIELANRINQERFSRAQWRMALIAHCLRDFRKNCRSTRGDIEDICTRCSEECYVKLGAELLEEHGIHPYISVSMDQRRLFKQLAKEHSGVSVLGIACIPELVEGLRLCERLGIPAVGIPLDANRCSRWLGECLETTFNLQELERLISGSV